MKIVIIGASQSSLIGSKLIQWWTGVPYSHVYARWYLAQQDKHIVYHASHGMVHFKSLFNFVKVNKPVKEYALYLTDEQFRRFSGKCVDLAGEPYSVLQLLQIAIHDLTKGLIKFKNQPGYICSELMGELLKDLGYTFNKPLHLIEPHDIMDALKNKGCLEI